MKKLFIISAVMLQSAVLFAQEPVKRLGKPPVQVQTNPGLSSFEAQQAEQIMQMQEFMEQQQNGNLQQDKVLILPGEGPKGATRPYLIMHK